MRLKIVSDGTGPGTRVLVVNDLGEQTLLQGVIAIEWEANVQDQHTGARLHVRAPEVELHADLAQVVHHHNGSSEEPGVIR